jgi:hypothetical protein
MRFFVLIVPCVALLACNNSPPANKIKNESARVDASFGEVAATNDPAPNKIQSSASETLVEKSEIKTSITITPASPAQSVDLVPVADSSKRILFAGAMRDSGIACNTVSNVYQLKQNGRFLDIMKVDCDTGEFQLTSLNGKAHIKPWTGNLLEVRSVR